jgi:IS5 family transposase
MHQTKKDNQWYYGMKVHIGVDKDFGLIHLVVTMAANVHDLTPLQSCCVAVRRWSTPTPVTRALSSGTK